MAHPSPSAFLTAPSPSPFLNNTSAHTPSAAPHPLPASFFPSAAALSPAPPPPAAARPSPLPSSSSALAPPRPPPATRPGAPPTLASARGAGLTVEDPTVEAARALGVLLGTGGGAGGEGAEGAEGLLDRVEREAEELLAGYERAFDEGGTAGAPDPSPSLTSLTALLSLLSRSSLGGFVPPSSSSSASSAAGLPPPTLSQAHIDAASTRVGELFREVQRVLANEPRGEGEESPAEFGEEGEAAGGCEEGGRKRPRLAGGTDADEDEADETQEQEQDARDALFDPLDGVFRCPACLWEVVEGECQGPEGCGAEVVVTEEMQRVDEELSYATHSLAHSPSRLPPLTPSPSSLALPTLLENLNVPPSMSLRYALSFSPLYGLVALADGPLRERYGVSTSAVQAVSLPVAGSCGAEVVKVDVPRPWKIHLGRGPLPAALMHDPEEDGRGFMEDLLDEVVEEQLWRGQERGAGGKEGREKVQVWTDGEDVFFEDGRKKKKHLGAVLEAALEAEGEQGEAPAEEEGKARIPLEWVTLAEETWVHPSELAAQPGMGEGWVLGEERDAEGRVRWVEWVTRVRGRGEGEEWEGDDEDGEGEEEEEETEETEEGEEEAAAMETDEEGSAVVGAAAEEEEEEEGDESDIDTAAVDDLAIDPSLPSSRSSAIATDSEPDDDAARGDRHSRASFVNRPRDQVPPVVRAGEEPPAAADEGVMAYRRVGGRNPKAVPARFSEPGYEPNYDALNRAVGHARRLSRNAVDQPREVNSGQFASTSTERSPDEQQERDERYFGKGGTVDVYGLTVPRRVYNALKGLELDGKEAWVEALKALSD
ncbi:hypothetical protein JCM6882_002139 [Rhodosporidiobolus microsporus]